jgi:hypothetical protein
MQDRHPASCGESVIGQIADGIDIAKFRPLTGVFGHFLVLIDNFIGIFDLVGGFYCNAAN